MSGLEQLVGVGFGNISTYLLTYNITTPFLSEIGNEYMNSFSTVLVSGGVVALIIYLILWISLYKESNNILCKYTIIIFLIMSMSASIFYSSTSVLYITFIVILNNYSTNNKSCLL